jgi:hypothetical protein
MPTTREQIIHSIQIEQGSQLKSSKNNNKNQISSVNASPSLAVKSKPGAVDPNLNDKIDQIKQQNDYLFICIFYFIKLMHRKKKQVILIKSTF